IEKYFNYCEIELLDEREEFNMAPMTKIIQSIGKANCNPTLKEMKYNVPTEYSKIQKNVYRYEIHETGEKKRIIRQLKIRTIKDYLSVDQTQLALTFPNYQLI
ncbi:hypothetical protein C2G38_2096182, partial [Gigaspora rosea]